MLLLSLVCMSICTEVPSGAVAQFMFDEGTGGVLYDTSRSHAGKIAGAQWVQQDGRNALEFRTPGSHVEFGDDRALKITGDSTILAWFRLDAASYPDSATNWTLLDCEDYRKEGYVLRVDGGTARVMYRVSEDGKDYFAFGTTPLQNHGVYSTAVVRNGASVTLYVDGKPDAEFSAPNPVFGTVPFRISSPGQSFSGTIFEVAILSRPLTPDEVAAEYWRGAERYGKDLGQHGQLRLTPAVYYDDKEVHAQVDFFGVMPVASDEKLSVQLLNGHGEALASQDMAGLPKDGRIDHSFTLEGLPPDRYEIRAVLAGAQRRVTTDDHFDYPEPPASVPAPDSAADALPTEPAPLPFSLDVTPDGGSVVNTGAQTFPLESTFSFPGGGTNELGTPGKAPGAEPEWKPSVHQEGPATWRIDARGKFYSVSRTMKAETGRILVADTVTNLAAEPVGIIFHNHLRPSGNGFSKAFIAGAETVSAITERDVKVCPTVFGVSSGLGIGMAALDDVYIVQALGAFDGKNGLDLFSREFAIDAGASYTLEWAVYLNSTGDYFDLVNAIRRDEHRNDVTVEGGFAFIHGSQQKRDASLVPREPQYYDVRNLRYITLACLSWCTDDPEISVEGIDFVDHPQERQRIKEMMASLRAVRPEVKGMFHVAHQLYANNRPNEHFPDSRVLDPNGNQTVYPNNYGDGGYFSRQRAEDNWRWWIYYPTRDNSFGKAMLDSVDVMMDELGCRGVFADGFLWGYGGFHTYDHWDGHSADIDPGTGTISRKKASVLLSSQEAMKAWAEKIHKKGGVVIANGVVPTRTACSMPIITDKEVNEGPDVALLPAPITLSNPSACRTEQEVHRDIINKLRWGNLYFFYGEPATLRYELAPARMYPITVQEVHAGYVKGNERLVTMKSGVYGWPESRDLHMAYRYDARGHRITPQFVTTCDAGSVRTRIDLKDGEIAILERIPIAIASQAAVNVIVERFDGAGCALTANGNGAITVKTSRGASQQIELNGQQKITVPAA